MDGRLPGDAMCTTIGSSTEERQDRSGLPNTKPGTSHSPTLLQTKPGTEDPQEKGNFSPIGSFVICSFWHRESSQGGHLHLKLKRDYSHSSDASNIPALCFYKQLHRLGGWGGRGSGGEEQAPKIMSVTGNATPQLTAYTLRCCKSHDGGCARRRELQGLFGEPREHNKKWPDSQLIHCCVLRITSGLQVHSWETPLVRVSVLQVQPRQIVKIRRGILEAA